LVYRARVGLKQFEDEAIAPTAARADTQRRPPVEGEPEAPGAISSGPLPLRTLPIGSQLCGERFKVLRRIGEGGMGVVYEAFDAQRKSCVALKTLSQSDGRGIYQFKNEFRALSRLHHPGLVRLHHLFVENDTWFFTMDLIDGQRFDRWARPGGVLDETRLRSGLRQLVLALAAIHDAGKLHRDVKSSNVLVSIEDRVIVLDLGLVIDCGKGGAGQTISEWILAGTPEYMAPEQAFGFPATPASDFYGMGVMLFEALTGRLPFRGQIGQILLAKQHEAELWPELLESNPAPDLAELCMALLSRDPGKRPSAADMLASGSLVDAGPVTESPSAPAPRSSATLLGRADELAALWAAHRDATLGQPVMVVVSGESGIGKTELCRAFLDQVQSEQLAVVLGGRCYEREGVPFKAIDPLIDELSRYFRRLSREEAAALLPRDAFALVKLFPVLGRVEVIAEAPAREVSDPYELQRRAFAAFAELIGRMRDRRPLILHIDDVHWTDADSATFLRHLLIDRGLCPALFILSQRSERVPMSGALEQLLGAARANPALSVRALPVHPLPASDAETLAQELLERTHPLDAGLCRSIALEARGSPFFVNELARLARSADRATERPSVSDVISARVGGMPAAARRLLEAAALVGQPLSMRVALEATGASHSDLDALLEAHLMRETETTGQELIECYHDRIRESVSAASSGAEAQDQYRALAAALSRDLDADPELVSRCFHGSGQRAEAARYAVLAAGRASLAMAFDHAADLYRNALALGQPTGHDAAELLTLLGQALENGGRGAEAADVYRQAAALDDGDASLELVRRAADQLLATGHVDEGTRLLRTLCGTLDVHFPTNPGSLLLSLAWTNLRLRLRDRVTALPAARSPSAREVLRLRTARTVVTSLSSYLPTHAASVAGQYLLMALDAGDVTDRVRSIGFNAYTQSQIDPRSPRSALLLERMAALANESGRAELIGFASMMKGTTDFHFDRYQDARRNFERALAHLRGCPGVMWEIDAANIYDQLSAIYCGDYADIARSAPALVDEALRRGRVWTGAMLSGFAGMPAWLGVHGAESYRHQLAEVAKSWTPRSRPHWPDYVLLMGEALLGIFEGRPEDGFALLEARREAYERYMLSRGPGIGPVGYAVHQGRCAASALGAARPGSAARVGAREDQRKAWAAHLRRAIRLVEKYGSPKARGIATLFEAVLSYERGARESGLGLLRQSLAAFERAEMHMYAAACRRRLGELVGGDEGRELVARGEAFMQRQAVRDIEAETEMSCPGFAHH
jgi:tetratricopeptide (TPR) repeat protein